MTTVRRFSLALSVVVAGALVFRVVYVLVRLRHEPLGGDSAYYSLQGQELAHGRWFIEPFRFRFDHMTEPSAFHPPLFSVYLGIVSRLGVGSVLGGGGPGTRSPRTVPVTSVKTTRRGVSAAAA